MATKRWTAPKVIYVSERNLAALGDGHYTGENVVLRAYKVALKNGKPPMYNDGRTRYKVGRFTNEKNCDADRSNTCSNGLNIATKYWCREVGSNDAGYQKNRCDLLLVEFRPKDLICVPFGSEGKFRVSRLKVIKKLTWR